MSATQFALTDSVFHPRRTRRLEATPRTDTPLSGEARRALELEAKVAGSPYSGPNQFSPR